MVPAEAVYETWIYGVFCCAFFSELGSFRICDDALLVIVINGK